jgi:hypothetical protein
MCYLLKYRYGDKDYALNIFSKEPDKLHDFIAYYKYPTEADLSYFYFSFPASRKKILSELDEIVSADEYGNFRYKWLEMPDKYTTESTPQGMVSNSKEIEENIAPLWHVAISYG